MSPRGIAPFLVVLVIGIASIAIAGALLGRVVDGLIFSFCWSAAALVLWALLNDRRPGGGDGHQPH